MDSRSIVMLKCLIRSVEDDWTEDPSSRSEPAPAYLLLCHAVVEVGLMVPRRIGDVSCGENHIV